METDCICEEAEAGGFFCSCGCHLRRSLLAGCRGAIRSSAQAGGHILLSAACIGDYRLFVAQARVRGELRVAAGAGSLRASSPTP